MTCKEFYKKLKTKFENGKKISVVDGKRVEFIYNIEEANFFSANGLHDFVKIKGKKGEIGFVYYRDKKFEMLFDIWSNRRH